MKTSKLATVAAFVMDGVNRITAGDWDGAYTDIDDPINVLSDNGQVQAANLDGKSFELWFGGNLYCVKVSEIRIKKS